MNMTDDTALTRVESVSTAVTRGKVDEFRALMKHPDSPRMPVKTRFFEPWDDSQLMLRDPTCTRGALHWYQYSQTLKSDSCPAGHAVNAAPDTDGQQQVVEERTADSPQSTLRQRGMLGPRPICAHEGRSSLANL